MCGRGRFGVTVITAVADCAVADCAVDTAAVATEHYPFVDVP